MNLTAAATAAPASQFAVVIDGHTRRESTWVDSLHATRDEATAACDAANAALINPARYTFHVEHPAA